jgi:hypothetical protein
MLVSGIDINYVIRKGRRCIQPTGTSHIKRPRQERLQRQMLVLMISSIIIFFATTLPVNLRVIVATYQITTNNVADLSQIAYETAILTVFLSFNYAVSNATCATIELLRRIIFFNQLDNFFISIRESPTKADRKLR